MVGIALIRTKGLRLLELRHGSGHLGRVVGIDLIRTEGLRLVFLGDAHHEGLGTAESELP